MSAKKQPHMSILHSFSCAFVRVRVHGNHIQEFKKEKRKEKERERFWDWFPLPSSVSDSCSCRRCKFFFVRSTCISWQIVVPSLLFPLFRNNMVDYFHTLKFLQILCFIHWNDVLIHACFVTWKMVGFENPIFHIKCWFYSI